MLFGYFTHKNISLLSSTYKVPSVTPSGKGVLKHIVSSKNKGIPKEKKGKKISLNIAMCNKIVYHTHDRSMAPINR